MNCAYTLILKSALYSRKWVATPRGLWRVSRANQETPLASNGASSPRILLRTCYDRLRFSYLFKKTNARLSSGGSEYGDMTVLIFDSPVFTRIVSGPRGTGNAIADKLVDHASTTGGPRISVTSMAPVLYQRRYMQGTCRTSVTARDRGSAGQIANALARSKRPRVGVAVTRGSRKATLDATLDAAKTTHAA